MGGNARTDLHGNRLRELELGRNTEWNEGEEFRAGRSHDQAGGRVSDTGGIWAVATPS